MLLSLSALSILGITISLFIIDLRIVIFYYFFIIFILFNFILSTKKYVDLYGKIIFETRKNIIRIVQESLGFIRQIILDDSHSFFIKEYDKNNIQNTLAGTAKSQIIAQIPRYLMESLILSALVISIIFMYLSAFDFNNYLTKSGAFILGLQKLLPLFFKRHSVPYIL